MAWSVVASAAAAGTTAGIDTTGADLIVAVSAGEAIGFSDSRGNTWTPLTQQIQNVDNKGQLFYCSAPSVGSGHTFSSPGFSYRAISVIALSGSSVSPFDVQNGSTGTSPLSTGAVTPTQANEIVIAGWALGGNCNTFSSGGGFTLAGTRNAVSGATYGAVLAYLIQTTAASVSSSLTYSGGGAGNAMIAAFKGAGAPAIPSLAALARIDAARRQDRYIWTP